MSVTWNSSSIPYVPPAHLYTCELSSLSPAPSLVNNFTIVSRSINGAEVNLSFKWSPPTVINGQLASYAICIGSTPLEPEEEPQDNVHKCSNIPYSVCD